MKSLPWGISLAAFVFGCSSPDEPAVTPPGPSGGGGSGGGSTAGSGGAVGGGGSSPVGGGGSGGASAGSAGVGGAGGECSAGALFCAPLGPMPESISATGLFPAAPDLSQHPAAMLEYVPDPPLWSDGMEKQRFLI